MVLIILVLLSLITIYFTRLLSEKRMKTAAISIAILYFYLIAWTYAVFFIDIAGFGFSNSETRLAFLHGSDIYHSFVSIADKMSVIPLEFLKAIVVVAIVLFVAALGVVFHGFFEITQAVITAFKEKSTPVYSGELRQKFQDTFLRFLSREIIILHCRMNC